MTPKIKTSCEICGQIRNYQTIYIERDKNFPEAVKELSRVTEDFRCCPKCGRYYRYYYNPQYLGTGNLDTLSLKKFSIKDSLLIKQLLNPEKKLEDFKDFLIQCNSSLELRMTSELAGSYVEDFPEEKETLLIFRIERFLETDDATLRDNLMNAMYFHPETAKIILEKFEKSGQTKYNWFGQQVYDEACKVVKKKKQ